MDTLFTIAYNIYAFSFDIELYFCGKSVMCGFFYRSLRHYERLL